jgi:Trypsin-co-occurring domain 2
MQLREFIKSSLLDIIYAVQDAQREIDGKGSGAAIAFKHESHEQGHRVEVDFDVAVTASAGAKAGGGGGINVVALKIGASGETVTENTAVSRIKFTLPVHLPHRIGEQV